MTEEIGDPFYATKSCKSTETILTHSKDAFSGQRWKLWTTAKLNLHGYMHGIYIIIGKC